jgi:hypothetical protein
MKKFSVEGTSNVSLEAAMASAMSKANLQGAGASSLNISVASAIKDAEGNFHVTVSVSAIEIGEENTLSDDDDEESGGGGKESDNARMTRRAEEISQALKDDLIHQFHIMHLGDNGPENMADAYKEGLHQVIEATPDVVVYDSMADQTDREDFAAEHGEYADNHENGGKDIVPVGSSNFDVVQEAAPGPSTVTADAGDRISVNVLSREVDEVIGLLSFGFYEPPRPANDPGEEEVVFSGGENDPQQPNPDPREIPPLPAPDKDQPAPTA